MVLLFLAHLPFAMNPHIGNKALALRERRHLRTFLLLAIPIGSILGATVLGGLQARALLGPGLRPDAAIPSLFAELFPPVLAGFLGVAILSAVMSTADGLLVSIAVIFSNGLYHKTFAPWIHAHKSVRGVDRISLNVSRVATVGAAVVAATLAWDPPSSSLFCSGLVWGESCRGRQDRFSLVRFGDAPTQARFYRLLPVRSAALCLTVASGGLAKSLWGSRRVRCYRLFGHGDGEPCHQTHGAKETRGSLWFPAGRGRQLARLPHQACSPARYQCTRTVDRVRPRPKLAFMDITRKGS